MNCNLYQEDHKNLIIKQNLYIKYAIPKHVLIDLNIGVLFTNIQIKAKAIGGMALKVLLLGTGWGVV